MNRLGFCPCFCKCVGRETLKRLQASSEVVGVDEVGEMPAQLVVIVVVVPFDVASLIVRFIRSIRQMRGFKRKRHGM